MKSITKQEEEGEREKNNNNGDPFRKRCYYASSRCYSLSFVIALGELMCLEFFRVSYVGYHPRAIKCSIIGF